MFAHARRLMSSAVQDDDGSIMYAPISLLGDLDASPPSPVAGLYNPLLDRALADAVPAAPRAAEDTRPAKQPRTSPS